MNISFIKYKYIYFALSGILVAVSMACLVIFGWNLGIDFTGGSILEIAYKDERLPVNEAREILHDIVGPAFVQSTEPNGLLIRMKEIDAETHQRVLSALGQDYQIAEELRFESIGEVVGGELGRATVWQILLALIAVVVYIALAFSRVKRPVRSWQYGIASLIGLFHNILITLGVFCVLGEFYGVQITIPIVTAFLIILGYSINDTVVVFDRIRENLIRGVGVTFEDTVDKSLNQTLFRSVSTSLTTLFVLSAIFFLGGDTLKYFALALMIGIAVGTYASLFLVSSLLTIFKKSG